MDAELTACNRRRCSIAKTESDSDTILVGCARIVFVGSTSLQHHGAAEKYCILGMESLQVVYSMFYKQPLSLCRSQETSYLDYGRQDQHVTKHCRERKLDYRLSIKLFAIVRSSGPLHAKLASHLGGQVRTAPADHARRRAGLN